jgi:2'-5' RNA ligase superfamily protein
VAVEGDSGIVVLVPAADPLVDPWRQRHDPAAAQGMPAHITVLYPFLPEARHDVELLDRLRALCATVPPIDLDLPRTARFPHTIYLDPEPVEPFRRLTQAIAAEWPEAPPYGGAFDDVRPHVTIADGVGVALMDRIDQDVSPQLPLHTRVPEAQLWVFDGARWRRRETLPFTGSAG